MKVQFIKSACVLVEHRGTRILCDPWLTDGIYYGSWFHYPPLTFQPSDFETVDYIYISHIHPDHLDPATLKQLPKSIPLLILNFEEKFVLNLLKKLGFTTIYEINHGDAFSLGEEFTLELFAADNCDPTICGQYFQCAIPKPYKKTIQIDSMAVLKGGGKVLINSNDCPYPLSRTLCDRIRSKYSTIDFLLLGYGGATAFPQCFDRLTPHQKLQEALKHRQMKLEQSLSYLAHLKPVAFLPFAGQYTLGGKLAPLNAFTSPPHVEDLPRIYPPLLEKNNIHSRMILLNSGDSYDLVSQNAPPSFIPPNPVEREWYINEVLSKKKFDYEEDPTNKLENQIDLSERLAVARNKMLSHQKEHGELEKHCRLYIDASQGYFYFVPLAEKLPIEKVMPNALISPFLRIGIDYALLVRILDGKAHWNNAEIGSHLRFYRDPDIYQRSLHFFLSFFHC